MASRLLDGTKMTSIPIKNKTATSMGLLTSLSRMLHTPLSNVHRYLYVLRALVFLLSAHGTGVYAWSPAWILAFAGVWSYTDHVVGHDIVMAAYKKTVCTIGLVYGYGYVCAGWHVSAMALLPMAYVVGHNDLTNQKWARVRRDLKRTCHLPTENKEQPGFADLTQLEWINTILERGWGTLKRTTEDTIREYSMLVLDENLPSFLSRMELTRLEFGRSPQITGIQVHSNSGSSSNAVVLDIDVVWHDTPDILLRAVTKAAVRTDVALMELDILGTLRLEFILDGWENEVPLWPCFSALSYGFTKKPEINFRMRAMKLDVMNLPLLSDWLDKLISTVIADNFTYPNCVT